MNKVISIVGLVLIAAAGVLAAISTSHEDILKSKKELCAKYTKNAQAALANNDIEKAFKFAKLAIKADPENRAGYKVLAQITDAKCKASQPSSAKAAAASSTEADNAKTENKAAQKPEEKASQTAAQPAKPAKPAAEEEEEMGC